MKRKVNKSKPAEVVCKSAPVKRSKLKLESYLLIPEVTAWRDLMDAYKAAYNYLDSELLKEGYNCSRFQIFFLLYFEGPKTAIQLANSMHVTRGNMSMFLKRLLSEGLIFDFRNEGGPKGVHYDLSHKGRRDFEKIFPKHVERIKKYFPRANPQVKAFLASLIKLR